MSSRSRRKTTRSLEQRATRQPRPGQSEDVPVMRASSIQDLLGSVPALLGFHPRRSLVAIAMQGKRLGFRLRVDLPEPDRVDDAADQLVAPLLAQSPDGVILVTYVEPEPSGARSAARIAADGLVAAMRHRLSAEGVQIREAVRCDGSRYWSYVCEVATCCPPEGTPYEIESSPMLAHAVFNGVEVLPDRDDLVRRFEPVSGRRRGRLTALTDRVVDDLLSEAGIDDGVEPGRGDDLGEGHGRLLRAGADFVQSRLEDLDADAARALSDEDAARLSFWTMLVPVRDLAWSYIEPDSAGDHLALWTSVVQRAVPPFEPAALCLAAFAAWLSGDGSQARCALDRVHAIAPEYTMGGLLAQTLNGFVPPAAWRAFDRDAIWAMIPKGGDDRHCA